MNYPDIIPKGTIIRFGEKPNTEKTSHHILAELTMDVVHNEEGRYYYAFTSKVLENPRGWHSKVITHKINLQYDTIVTGKNTDMKTVLERYDD